MLSTTEEHLEEVFTKAADPQPAGKKAVERVKKLKDYAFIHFSERDEALRALKAINGELILYVTILAKLLRFKICPFLMTRCILDSHINLKYNNTKRKMYE